MNATWFAAFGSAKAIVSGMCFVMSVPSASGQVRALTVEAVSLETVPVQVAPQDREDALGGDTPFVRRYDNGVSVTLSVPSKIGPHVFVKWLENGVSRGSGAQVTVAMNGNKTLKAVYFANHNLVGNGGFEEGDAGWSLAGNLEVHLGAPYVPSEGVRIVVFNSGNRTPNGRISRVVATTPGMTYSLGYDLGVLAFNSNEQRMAVTVTGASTLISATRSISGVGGGATRWLPQSHTFTADSTSTTLQFADASPVTQSIDMLFDNVLLSASNSGSAPLARADEVLLHAGNKVAIDVLANDSGIFDRGTVQVVSPPAVGSVAVLASGRILYDHPGGAAGPAEFFYRVSGEGGFSQAARVRVSLSDSLRIPSPGLNVPQTPPSGTYDVVPAFPGVSFLRPLCFASPPGDAKRLFVCELGGKIKVIPDVTAENPTGSLVLDLQQVITSPPRVPAESWKPGLVEESGLLGLAFHPNYAANGYFYVSYLMVKASDPTVWYNRLSRFRIPAGRINDPAPVADPASELILIEQRDRGEGHNASDLHFGNDGYLYWSLGDEVNPRDVRKNSQRIEINFFAGMIRIDVDKRPGNLEPNAHPNPIAGPQGFSTTNSIPRDEAPAGSGNMVARYSIPIDNPYVHASKGGTWDGVFNGTEFSGSQLPYVRSEFWAVGLRSPWRFSIDRQTGEMWLGDVGQNLAEEVNLMVRGGNYGWAYYEALHPGPRTPPPGFSHVPPVYEYLHVDQPGDPQMLGNCVIGGVVSRGDRLPELHGAYIFGDTISGHIWALERANGQTKVRRIAAQPYLTTFGLDPSNGDVLVSDYLGGRVMRLVKSGGSSGFPATLSATGLFADLADLSPSPGVLPYEPNLPFWSDHAVKRRWFAIPRAEDRMTWKPEGAWEFPAGQVWVKHFDLESVRGDPLSPKIRLETRMLVRTGDGVYGVSYRWNEAGTEANLVEAGGMEFDVDLTVDGQPYRQRWGIPSRSQCLTCHQPQAGHALSFDTRQMNRAAAIPGFGGNQIELLHSAGYFTSAPPAASTLPRHSAAGETGQTLDHRARSYLGVNCSYCHSGGTSTVGASWDGRPWIPLGATGLIDQSPASGEPGYKLIDPGDPDHSVVLQRIAASNGFTRMPPLATHEIDSANVALIHDWISTMEGTPNTPPVANADFHSTIRGTPLTVASPGVLGNDGDADGDALSAELVTGASHGSLHLDPGGGFEYLPGGDFVGTDSFVYQCSDGEAVSSAVTVMIEVSDLPVETIVNGSFESEFDGWTATGTAVVKTGSPYAATDGTRLVAFNSGNSPPGGVVSQSFATVAGTAYELSFDYGVLSYTTTTQVLGVEITGIAPLRTGTFSVKRLSTAVRWLSASLSFTADSPVTTIVFRDLSTSTNGLDLLLDNVRVVRLASRRLVVSSEPSGGALVVLSVPDNNGAKDGATPFERIYQEGTRVTLAAAPSHDGLRFEKWTRGGVDLGGGPTLEVDLEADIALTAHYVEGGLDFANGSFEDGFEGWTVAGNVSIQQAAPYVSVDGTRLVAFNSGNSVPNGSLTRAFATLPGMAYEVSFHVGVLAYNNSSQVLEVSVAGAAPLASATITVKRRPGSTIYWESRSLRFTADSTLATLSFRDRSTLTNALDLTLDHVGVTGLAMAAMAMATVEAAALPQVQLPPARLVGSPGDWRLRIDHAEAGDYVLECSSDLATWRVLDERRLEQPGGLELGGPAIRSGAAGSEPRMFYRIGRRR